MDLVGIICYIQILERNPSYCLSVEFFLEMTFLLMEIWGYGFVNLMRYKGRSWTLFIQVMGLWIVISPTMQSWQVDNLCSL